MKKIIFNTGIFLILMCLVNPMMAVNKPVKESTVSTAELSNDMTAKEIKKLEKFEKKFEKRMAKMEKKANNAAIDLDDPVDKWMWFWILGWGAGLAAYLVASVTGIGFFAFIGSALMVFGFVAMVFWLVKKFS